MEVFLSWLFGFRLLFVFGQVRRARLAASLARQAVQPSPIAFAERKQLSRGTGARYSGLIAKSAYRRRTV